MGGSILKTMQTEDKRAHCSGCGVQLQSEHKEQIGYIPKQARGRGPLVCYRCFRMKHYNEASTLTLDDRVFHELLHQVSDTDSLVVNIIDLFDFEGSLITGISRFVGNNDVLLVVNKADLIPKAVNPNKVVNWIQRQAKQYGLQIVDVVLCSAMKNRGIDRLIDLINIHREGKDVYVVGATNVGKSTLINRLLRHDLGVDEQLTTSRYPGTTLDLVSIPLEDGRHLIDTPGIVQPGRLTENVPSSLLGKIMPNKEIKPVVYQLNAGQTLFFGALARLDFISGEPLSFTCYMSNDIHIHRTKLERADTLYETHKGQMLSPPTDIELAELPPLVKHDIRIPTGEAGDVAISGLGWIKANTTSGATLQIQAPKGVKVVIREPLI